MSAAIPTGPSAASPSPADSDAVLSTEEEISPWRWLNDLTPPAMPPEMETAPERVEAVKFMENCEPYDKAEYRWVAEHARAEWEQCEDDFKGLDDKADSILKYLGGGTGLFALGVLSKVDASNVRVVYWAIPAIVVAVVAIFLAAAVRRPSFAAAPPPIPIAKQFADSYGPENIALGNFIGYWHYACVEATLVNRRKGRFLEGATWCYCTALALLILPILAACFHAPESPQRADNSTASQYQTAERLTH